MVVESIVVLGSREVNCSTMVMVVNLWIHARKNHRPVVYPNLQVKQRTAYLADLIHRNRLD